MTQKRHETSVFLCTYVLSFLSLMRSSKYFHPKPTIVSIHKICQIFDEFLRTLMGIFFAKITSEEIISMPRMYASSQQLSSILLYQGLSDEFYFFAY